MFSSVIDEMKKNKMKAHMRRIDSVLIVTSVEYKLSPSTPFVNNVIMDEPRSLNISFAVGSAPSSGGSAFGSGGLANCTVNKMAKMYVTMIKNKSMKPTACVALTMPLTRVISSGKNLINLAILVSRSKRNNLMLLNIPVLAPSSELVRITTKGMTHVSNTINITNVQSKTNHASRRQMIFLLKAMNLTTTSVTKYKQNMFSTIVLYGSNGNLPSIERLLWFHWVSTAIQMALSTMTASVAF
mmetsp:Transcript_72703/g.210498  ORF Transcript_72703/g.210498 Transcript_72703/m.210498 type:complete len:242 (+) Transcript_72703:396-1121(+)